VFSSFAFRSRPPVSSSSFARPVARRAKLRHWLAGLPLIAVAAIAFNGPAPATMSTEPVTAAELRQEYRWSLSNAKKLLAVAEDSAAEGLNPADYQVDALRRAIATGEKGPELDMVASAAALSLAHDYANGRIEDKAALDWHFAPPVDANLLGTELDSALDQGRVDTWLRGLLPEHSQYRALRVAYAAAPDAVTRDQLRANLERWRWMPRDLGDRYIYVNVPSYRLELINDGAVEASYNVVVGSPKTPTPQLLLHAQSVVANPSWTLPPSVLKEGGWQGKGYQVSKRADGSLMVRQPPGPRNALGRIKIDMPNAHAIYLHDTPAKAAFGRDVRALSHGCIRVQNIEALAAQLQSPGSLDLEDALADPGKTKVLQLERSVPVYLAYFTAQANVDGTVDLLDDPYKRDQATLARLGRGGIGGAIVIAAR